MKKLGQEGRTNYQHGKYETEEPTSIEPKVKK